MPICISFFLDPGSSPWGESYHGSRESAAAFKSSRARPRRRHRPVSRFGRANAAPARPRQLPFALVQSHRRNLLARAQLRLPPERSASSALGEIGGLRHTAASQAETSGETCPWSARCSVIGSTGPRRATFTLPMRTLPKRRRRSGPSSPRQWHSNGDQEYLYTEMAFSVCSSRRTVSVARWVGSAQQPEVHEAGVFCRSFA